MARGPLLAPAEIQKAALEFGRTGSYAAAARAIERDPDVTRRALLRHGGAARLELHTAAVDAGLERASQALTETLLQARTAASAQSYKGLGGGTVHHADRLAKLLEGLARATETLARVAESADRRRTLRVQRAKLRAETALARARTEAVGRGVVEGSVATG